MTDKLTDRDNSYINSESIGSTSNENLRRQVDNSIKRLLYDPYKKVNPKQSKKTAANFPSLKIPASKSVRKQTHFSSINKKSKHKANLTAIEKLIKIREEIKCETEQSITSPSDDSKAIPRLISVPEDDVTSFHLIDRSMKKAKLSSVNEDVLNFGNNNELIRTEERRVGKDCTSVCLSW